MWFSLFATVLVLAITFYQGLQGLFTALISCILTVLAAALAFGCYENMYFSFLASSQPDHGRALALLGIFIVTLLLLRAIFDALITGNMHFPMYADRAGGGIFGFVTAMIIVGMLSIGFQMLPFGSNFLGFSRFALVDKDTGQAVTASDLSTVEWDKVKQVRQKTWLNPGGFTTTLVSHLSANALHGTNNFGDIYPDFLGYIYRAKTNPMGRSRLAVESDALSVVGYWDLSANDFFNRIFTPKEGKKMTLLKPAGAPEPGTKRWAVRVNLDPKAKDTDSVFRFTPEQIRLLARERKDGPLKEYFPVGISEIAAPQVRGKLVQLFPGEGIARTPQPGPKLEMDVVYQLPDQPDFQPVFLEFKQNARAELKNDLTKKRPAPLTGSKTPGAPAAPAAPTAPPAIPAPPSTPPKPGGNTATPPSTDARPKDRVSGIGEVRKETTWSNELPFALTEYNGVDLETKTDGEILGGRVFAQLDQNWAPRAGSKTPLKKFFVPERKYFLQLSVEKLQPQSWLGNIYGGIIDTIGDFYIVDQNHNNYKPVGAYAMATVGGKNLFEMVFLNDVARDADRGIPKFQSIHPRDLEGNYAYYFLFHLPPKTKPEKLHTGRSDVDLTPLNLEAPGESK